MRTTLRPLLGLFVCSVVALPGIAGAEPLEEAVTFAMTKHPTVQAIQEGSAAAREQVKQERSAWFPTVSASTTGGRLYGDNSTSRGLSVTRGAGYSYLWEGQVAVNQLIFDGMATPRRIDAASARAQSAVYSVSDTRETLALRATLSYLNVLRAREGLSLVRKHRDTIEGYVGRIQKMVKEGAADEAESRQAQDVAAMLDSMIADQEGQVSAAEAAYAEAIGHLPDSDMARPIPAVSLIPQAEEEAISFALKNHPKLQAAGLAAQAEKAEIAADQGALFPTVTGELSYLKRDQSDLIGGEATDARAVVHVNWDLSTGGGEFASIRRSRHEHAESLARQDEAARGIERDIRLAYAEMQTAKKQRDIIADRLLISSGLMETYKQQFEAAKVRLLQLMQGENQKLGVALEQLNSEYRLMAAEYSALASMGRLQQSLLSRPQDAGK